MRIDALQAHVFPEISYSYDFRDIVLYGLSLGYGARPLDPAHLRFCYERELEVVPSQITTMAYPGIWAKHPEFEIDFLRLVHGEQSVSIHKPLRPAATLTARHEFTAVEDLGPEKGAKVFLSKKLYDERGELVAEAMTVTLVRGDGGCGSFGVVPFQLEPLTPDAAPNVVAEVEGMPQQALLYRLVGDFNPLHVDPEISAKAGFERPILHGLCTLGLLSRAVIERLCGGHATAIRRIDLRFSRPFFPGETLQVEFFDEGKGRYRFRAYAKERNILVLDRGLLELDPAQGASA